METEKYFRVEFKGVGAGGINDFAVANVLHQYMPTMAIDVKEVKKPGRKKRVGDDEPEER